MSENGSSKWKEPSVLISLVAMAVTAIHAGYGRFGDQNTRMTIVELKIGGLDDRVNKFQTTIDLMRAENSQLAGKVIDFFLKKGVVLPLVYLQPSAENGTDSLNLAPLKSPELLKEELELKAKIDELVQKEKEEKASVQEIERRLELQNDLDLVKQRQILESIQQNREGFDCRACEELCKPAVI